MYGTEYQIVTSGEPLDRETTDRYLSQRERTVVEQ